MVRAMLLLSFVTLSGITSLPASCYFFWFEVDFRSQVHSFDYLNSLMDCVNYTQDPPEPYATSE